MKKRLIATLCILIIFPMIHFFQVSANTSVIDIEHTYFAVGDANLFDPAWTPNMPQYQLIKDEKNNLYYVKIPVTKDKWMKHFKYMVSQDGTWNVSYNDRGVALNVDREATGFIENNTFAVVITFNPTTLKANFHCIFSETPTQSPTTVPTQLPTEPPTEPSSEAGFINEKLPTKGKIYFESTQTLSTYNKSFYCHVWESNGDYIYSWQTSQEKMTPVMSGSNLYSYDIPSKNFNGNDFNANLLLISGNSGWTSYETTFSDHCIGDTLYIDANDILEDPYHSTRTLYALKWKKNPYEGSHISITSTGKVQGIALTNTETPYSIVNEFIQRYTSSNYGYIDYSLITEEAQKRYIDEIVQIISPSYIKDIKYNIANKQVTITQYNGNSKCICIPNNIDGYPVTAIGNNAFKNCSNLETIYIGSNISNIEDNAFYNCNNLRSIVFSGNLINVGKNAFSNCNKLSIIDATITVSNIKYKIENGSVTISEYGNKEKTVIIPSTIGGLPVTKIASSAFKEGNNLKSIVIPNSVTNIGESAFENCNNLTSVTIPNNVKYIATGAFYGCSSLTNINIPDSITNICEYTFYDCNALTNLVISKNVTSIDNNAFGYCTNLTDIYYTGTKNEWKDIVISYGNDYLTNATIHYDCPIISLNKNKITLEVGQTYTLSATVLPKAYDKLTWKSSNKAVATVTSKGKISAKSEGTASITLKTADGKNTSCKVTVVASSDENPDSISLNKSSLIVGVGETFNFSCKTDKGTSAKVTYTSSKTSVATVDSNGNMKAKSAGTAIITATTNNGKTAKCRVTVKNAPTSISINRKNSIMGLGETFYLEGSLANDEASRVLTFSSSKPEVATVSDGGIVTAKSIGTAIVSITTYNGQKATCRVTVRNAPTSLTFNKTSITLKQGESFYLESQFKNGEYARMVTYNSPNKSIATVSGSGVITAKSKGSVQITGKTYNGKTAVCTVTVK